MQFFTTVSVLALFTSAAIAGTISPNARDLHVGHEKRVSCKADQDVCNDGVNVGQTNCRCNGQKATCDLWYCGKDANSGNNFMVCGASSSGCGWIY